MHNNDFWLESLSVCTEKVRKQVDSKCLQPSVKQCRLCHGLCISANGVRSCQNYWNYELRKAPSDLIHRAIPTGKYLSGNSLIMIPMQVAKLVWKSENVCILCACVLCWCDCFHVVCTNVWLPLQANFPIGKSIRAQTSTLLKQRWWLRTEQQAAKMFIPNIDFPSS